MSRDDSPLDARPVSRRGLLAGAAAAAGAGVAGPFLIGCGAPKKETATGPGDLSKILPAYVPSEAVKPDIAAVKGANGAESVPAFLKYPDNPVTTVNGPVGKGGTYNTMTPLWGSIPPSSGNAYYDAVNQALGATLKINPADGNTYNQQLPPLFAADKLPDMICIPAWWNVELDMGHGVEKFVDLTPYLAGDKVKAYPNLASLPSGAWQAGVWNGKLYGIPVYPDNAGINGTYFFRKDILDKKGINPDSIKTPDDLANLGKELTDAKGGVWAFEDLFGDDASYACQLFKFPGTTNWGIDSSGKLIHKYETDGIKEALNWHAKIAKSGYMHPDAVALKGQESKQRFWSGKSIITADGTGAWDGDDAKSGKAANPEYRRGAFKLISKDGKPQVELRPGAGIFSYLNKKLSDAQIKEVLSVLNYIAAPYGSKEWLLVNFGKEGSTYTMQNGNPVLTESGNKLVATSFQFLVSPVNVITVKQGFVDVARDLAAWQGDMVKYAVKPVFYGMNLTPPSQYSSIGRPVTDTIADVRMGRKPISAFEDAVKTWRSAGGDALRAFFEDVRKKFGTGQ